nr:MAG TPA: hypothetical protein [Caudoviricetes sp.]
MAEQIDVSAGRWLKSSEFDSPHLHHMEQAGRCGYLPAFFIAVKSCGEPNSMQGASVKKTRKRF